MLLLINFLAASTGLSIYFHKCTCEQRLVTTLFVEHKCHEEKISSCCIAEEKENSIKESDCGCKTEHLTVKVNDYYNSVNQTELGKKFEIEKILQFLSIESTSNLVSQEFVKDHKFYLPDNSPPTKTVGKDLIILLHQNKSIDHIS